MKPSSLIHLGILLLTVWLTVNLCRDQRVVWPVKKVASQTLQRGKVKSLCGLLTELSLLDPDMFPPTPSSSRTPKEEETILKDDYANLVRHLKRLVATGDAPEKLLENPINRQHMEVSGLATAVDTLEGILWVGRVKGYHGPIVAFAMNGEILHVAWAAGDAMAFYAEGKWITPEDYSSSHHLEK